MNFPANLTLVGIDPFLTEEQALEVQQALEREQHIIDSLDAEIAHAHAALASLRRRRNESQKAISMNSIPSESQVSTIRSNISEHGRRLEQLEKEIIEAEEARDLLEQQQLVAQTESSEFSREQLTNEREQHQGRITHLVVQRDQVQTDIEALQAVISPIRRLPLEILSEIFVECFPKIKFTRPSAHEPPLLLAQICRRWRHVAISTPKIWSAILITVTEHCHPDLSLLQTFIDRSAMHPLSFRIKEELDADAASSMHEAAFELLWSAHARWRDVQLDYKDWRTNSSLGRITETPLLLETLSLKREYWNADALEPLSHLFAAPHLRKIIWFGVLKNHPNPAEIMPLELLQKLNLDNPSQKLSLCKISGVLHYPPDWSLALFLFSSPLRSE
ncbi:hypothetical protein D9757_002548 [Collybiopsis confluens]|uniref:F-box domain-containing protein n=1 Tax=Collybiopsis confluens TaxID=2823264 RepID=A0A8H5MF26_9AGAR|nr:hypothetical protein D9757_002548 [Collybiopsis confluens]